MSFGGKKQRQRARKALREWREAEERRAAEDPIRIIRIDKHGRAPDGTTVPYGERFTVIRD